MAALALAPVAVPCAAADVPVVTGPASVSLGAVAVLDLPEGWRFVAPKDLPAWFAGSPRRAGAWDRGVVLPGEGGPELRLVFEPLGAVSEAARPDPAALLPKAQALARERARRAGAVEGLTRELADWRWEPSYDDGRKLLRFGGWWREGMDENVDLHLRWLARRGVLKLDWSGAQDGADAFAAASEALDEGLRFNDGEGYEAVGPGDKAAPLDLDGLVLDGLFGRAGLVGGAPPKQEIPLWQWIAGLLAAALALAWAAVKLWRGLEGWLERRGKAKKDAQRLDYIEKKLGGSADDVEEIEEDGQLGYGEEK